jgi:mono/diheme cytochrome c family protein
MADGQLFATITHGVNNMPAYGPQIPVEDRWSIVSYVRALQLSMASKKAE